jgi:hypothetical protein
MFYLTKNLCFTQYEDGVAGDRLPLPKCVYINTDFPGTDLDCDDVKDRNRNDPDDVRCRGGVNAGSAR